MSSKFADSQRHGQNRTPKRPNAQTVLGMYYRQCTDALCLRKPERAVSGISSCDAQNTLCQLLDGPNLRKTYKHLERCPSHIFVFSWPLWTQPAFVAQMWHILAIRYCAFCPISLIPAIPRDRRIAPSNLKCSQEEHRAAGTTSTEFEKTGSLDCYPLLHARHRSRQAAPYPSTSPSTSTLACVGDQGPLSPGQDVMACCPSTTDHISRLTFCFRTPPGRFYRNIQSSERTACCSFKAITK
ncbi:hypothetical protein QBC38DRAFT_463650 [Podospora fimiseda]|uniref:Uncharacterized protein n=1 Tax=Podospora fimiseda TaxID=252190 RepID=A0AAN7BZX4_9PEZI|nr:hypothetical protein QBC38DRAFT_463650 [Podospora fimiseda]